MNDITVAIPDLKKYRVALRAVSKELPKQLRLILKEAVTAAADEAQRLYDQNYTSRRGRTRGTIRALATQTSAGVAFGGARYPWVPGQEFGSNKYKQFSPWAGNAPGGGGKGKAIFPAVRSQAEPVAKVILERFNDLAHEAYPER